MASPVLLCGLQGAQPGSPGSWAPEDRLDRGDSWSQLLYSMLDLPGSGVELVSPALAGGFFTTEPPGKPSSELFEMNFLSLSTL